MWNSNEVLYISNPDRTVHNYSGSISRTNTPPPLPRIREFDVRIPYIFSCQDFVRMSLLPFPLSKTCKIRSEARCIGFEWRKGSRLIRAKSSYEKNIFAKFLIGRGAYVKLLLKCSFSLFHYNISFTPNKGGGANSFLQNSIFYLYIFQNILGCPLMVRAWPPPPYW